MSASVKFICGVTVIAHAWVAGVEPFDESAAVTLKWNARIDGQICRPSMMRIPLTPQRLDRFAIPRHTELVN